MQQRANKGKAHCRHCLHSCTILCLALLPQPTPPVQDHSPRRSKSRSLQRDHAQPAVDDEACGAVREDRFVVGRLLSTTREAKVLQANKKVSDADKIPGPVCKATTTGSSAAGKRERDEKGYGKEMGVPE